jgi:serine protease Do
MNLRDLFFSTILLGFISSAHAASFVDTVAKVKESVVGIALLLPTRTAPAQTIGTGFAVGNGRIIVTSLHVVRQQDPQIGQILFVLVQNGSQVDRRRAKIITLNRLTDLALLEIEGAPLPALKLRESVDLAPDGSEIGITGFPIGNVLGFQPTTTRGIVSARPENRTPELSSNSLDAATIRAPRFFIYQLDVIAYPGNSGGPVYDSQTGEVIGVVAAGFIKSQKEKVLSDPSGITYAIPSGHIRDLLEQLSIQK